MGKNTGFRGWFYFRQGWANYFTFLMAAVNTLTVTYFLAIERYPVLTAIFPNFIQYVLIVTSIGIPLLVLVGYVHWKRSSARKAEVDIFYETSKDDHLSPNKIKKLDESKEIIEAEKSLEEDVGFKEIMEALDGKVIKSSVVKSNN